jgi:hypothetical protein
MFTRINKRIARKLFEEGKPIYTIAHKLRPGYPFSMGLTIFPDEEKRNNRTFDAAVNNFIYYNCSHETGYYPAFYLERTTS